MGYSLSRSSSERAREIRSVLRLSCAPGLGTRGLWRILRRFGSARRALEARPGQLDAAAGKECSGALASPGLDRRVRDALDRCRTPEIEILLWSDKGYPGKLGHLVDPPPILFARGRLELLGRPSVTIVGSRRSTAYGRRSAEALAAQMALRGITVVSGLALGIDGASHRGALEAGGDTIAVLGSGVDLIQPASHRRLGERVAREGLLLSEFLPGEPARAYHFPRRNRILAALGSAVVVVEAAEKSGALITVEHALDLGRDVYAVPGALDAPQSRGCNILIRQGAQVITSPEEFGRDLGLGLRLIVGFPGENGVCLGGSGRGAGRSRRRGSSRVARLERAVAGDRRRCVRRGSTVGPCPRGAYQPPSRGTRRAGVRDAFSPGVLMKPSAPHAVRILEPPPNPGAIRSVYVHAPFCSRRCCYCDFAVKVAAADCDVWLDALRAEIRALEREGGVRSGRRARYAVRRRWDAFASRRGGDGGPPES